ncbi:unnamed protein product, partial [Dicrocoelium dendriticum]
MLSRVPRRVELRVLRPGQAAEFFMHNLNALFADVTFEKAETCKMPFAARPTGCRWLVRGHFGRFASASIASIFHNVNGIGWCSATLFDQGGVVLQSEQSLAFANKSLESNLGLDQ